MRGNDNKLKCNEIVMKKKIINLDVKFFKIFFVDVYDVNLSCVLFKLVLMFKFFFFEKFVWKFFFCGNYVL